MNTTEIKELNSRIEKIQVSRTKQETKKEMLMGNLASALETYAKTYGVDLRKEKLSQTMDAVTAEKSRIDAEIRQEYELKVKVVTAIESGDIATAKKLLGVEDTEEEFSIEGGESIVEDVAETDDLSEDGDEDDVPWEEDDTSESDEVFEEATSWNNSETEYSSSDEDEKSSVGEVVSGDTDWGDLSVEDSDEDEGVQATGKSFLEAVAKAEPAKKSDNINDFGDEDLDDFGFGSITKGTKFGKK